MTLPERTELPWRGNLASLRRRRELEEAVFVNSAFRRISAPLLDARRAAMGRAPLWVR